MSDSSQIDGTVVNAGNKTYCIYPGPEELANAAAGLVRTIIIDAVQTRGRCNLALSGGSTPRLLYEILSRREFGDLPWESVALFWSDERYVPHEHTASNYRMAREALLDRLPVKPAVYPVNTQLHSPKLAADHYEATMRRALTLPGASDWPCFDCILLGMGTDGHTASLFPGEKALQEKAAWAAVAQAPDESYRITLTLPVINAARRIIFLVAGREKTDSFTAIAGGRNDLPAAMVQAAEVTWLLDAAAAAEFAKREIEA